MSENRLFGVAESAAEREGVNVRRSYRGRGMLGDEGCLAVEGPRERVERVAAEVIRAGARFPRMDSMGMGVVYYWPDVVAPAEAYCSHCNEPVDEGHAHDEDD